VFESSCDLDSYFEGLDEAGSWVRYEPFKERMKEEETELLVVVTLQ
jgi:hypothetical protein